MVRNKHYSKVDHIIPFSSSWRVVCGFLGEQGIESIHHIINLVKCRYKSSIKKSTERLRAKRQTGEYAKFEKNIFEEFSSTSISSSK